MAKITKAILTGGGRATRLRPITSTINKHLIPLANQPMIWHAIDKVVKAGIKEIFINTNPGETELQKVVGNGTRWGVSIRYFEQIGGPQGIAHVVKQAEDFIGNDSFLFYLSDNIILADLAEMVTDFANQDYDCMLAFSQVKDPQRFGVPYFSTDGQLLKIVEKPSDPPNNLAVTGIYLYGPKLFFETFSHIDKSQRGEYEISDIHSYLLEQGHKVGYQEITGWWKDTGKPDDLLVANALLMDQLADSYWQKDKIFIDENVEIKDKVKITGPAIINKDCVLNNCVIEPYTTIGQGCTIKDMTIANSLVFANCHLDGETKIVDSIIGKNVKVENKGVDQHTHNLIIGDNSVVEL